MRLIDLSQPLYDGAPNCPTHPPVAARTIADHADGGWRMELVTLASHTGSHVDAPLHKVAGGRSISEVPLGSWAGRAYVADLRGCVAEGEIGASELAAALGHAEALDDRIVLLATGWGEKRAKCDEWLHHAPRVTPAGARWLVERRVRGVGIDHYSVGGLGAANDEVHELLLGAGVWIVEELRFPTEVFTLPQPVKFWSLPINFRGFSGAFCRPVIEVE